MKKKDLFNKLFITVFLALLTACGSENQDSKEATDGNDKGC
jgi:hypothetical protein